MGATDVIQIAGAMLVLAGYGLAQFRVLDQHSVLYLLLNYAGSTILAILAVAASQWGFLLLEGSWSLISLFGLAKSVPAARWRGEVSARR